MIISSVSLHKSLISGSNMLYTFVNDIPLEMSVSAFSVVCVIRRTSEWWVETLPLAHAHIPTVRLGWLLYF